MPLNGKILLEVNGICKNFGGVTALRDINFSIPEGKIVALIGPNGAGKTTLFNVISGFYTADSGSIKFNGEDITKYSSYVICRKGVSRTFQITRLFLEMTSFENVMIGAMFGSKKNLDFKEAYEKAQEGLEFVNLSDKRDILTGNLTLPDRKKVDLARALASDPKIVLLDEIISGLNPTEVEFAIDLISRVKNDLGVTVFWVEHVMKAVIRLVDNIIVLHYGKKIADDTPQKIVNDQGVIDAYLGGEYIF